jgi:hypothetical protein
MTNTVGYREQLDRVMRWYARFNAIDTGGAVAPSDDHVDAIYAFFVNCYHLSDWIKYDAALPEPTRNAVKDHVHQTARPLKLCADLCTSIKHLDRRSNTSDENPGFTNKVIGLDLGSGFPTISMLRYEVQTDNGPIDAFDLAAQCLTQWDVFLSKHNLARTR